jgi:hypothetical protein
MLHLNQYFFKIKTVVLTTVLLLSLAFSIDLPSASAGLCQVCQQESSLKCGKCQARFYCSKEHQNADWKQWHKKECALKDGVEISESSIPGAGRGLFAKRDFNRGDLIAVYDGQIVAETVFHQIIHGFNSFDQTLPSGLLLQGKTDPIQPHLAAQIANDPYMNTETIQRILSVDCAHVDEQYLKFIEDVSAKYITEEFNPTDLKSNARLSVQVKNEQTLAFFQATRSIHPGQEILYPYGAAYWISIARNLCGLHGLPQADILINRAGSRGAEKVNNPHATNAYVSYVSEKAFAEIRAFYTRHHDLRISHLLAEAGVFQPYILKAGAFAKLLADLQVNRRMDEISNLPNSEFMSPHNWGRPHPNSRALILEILDYNFAERNRTGDLIFTFLDGKKKRRFTEEEIEKLRGTLLTWEDSP